MGMDEIATIQIGMREFLRNPKKIKDAVALGQRFEVLDRTTPVFLVGPPTNLQPKKYTQDDLKQFQFVGKETDVAGQVDEYMYGRV